MGSPFPSLPPHLTRLFALISRRPVSKHHPCNLRVSALSSSLQSIETLESGVIVKTSLQSPRSPQTAMRHRWYPSALDEARYEDKRSLLVSRTRVNTSPLIRHQSRRSTTHRHNSQHRIRPVSDAVEMRKRSDDAMQGYNDKGMRQC